MIRAGDLGFGVGLCWCDKGIVGFLEDDKEMDCLMGWETKRDAGMYFDVSVAGHNLRWS